MYDIGTRERTLALVAQGRSLNSVSKQTGVSRAAIRSWQARLEPLATTPCPRCADTPTSIENPSSYAYLLGLYLGDGWISTSRSGVHFLRIACDDAWPGLIDACAEAIQLARPDNKVFRLQREGCKNITCWSKHWPCLLPQHGPGKKHDRRIALEPWQQLIVDAHPWEFIRGLIHSDGCRITNWATRMVRDERKRYEYPGTSSPTSPTTSAHSSATRSPPSASSGRPDTRRQAAQHLRSPTGIRRPHGCARRAEILSRSTSGCRPRRCGGRGPGSWSRVRRAGSPR